jgi:hypothetical protein
LFAAPVAASKQSYQPLFFCMLMEVCPHAACWESLAWYRTLDVLQFTSLLWLFS